MLPVETESFKDDGVMVGLWRQCIRYLPDKYECYENLNQNIENNDDPLCKCNHDKPPPCHYCVTIWHENVTIFHCH